MSRLVQESRRDGGAIHAQPEVLRLLDAEQFRARQLDRLRQLSSPRGAV